MKSIVAALDFGTSKIVTLIAETSGNHRCDIQGAGLANYDGYMESNWNNPDDLNAAIERSVSEAEKQARRKLHAINVGIPGEFTKVCVAKASVMIQGTDPRVAPKHVEKIFAEAEKQIQPVNGIVIHRSPAWFVVDGGQKTLEPVGQKGTELQAMICYVVAERFFLDDVMGRLRELGLSVSGFFSGCTGEAMLFVPEEERDRTAILIDMGYLCTEVMVVEGDAIIFKETLEVGAGHIAADVSEGLSIPLEAAEQIKREYMFNVSTVSATSMNQTYTVSLGDGAKSKSFTQDEVAAVLEPRVDEIAEMIQTAIEKSGIVLSNWSSYYLTGGGLAINRGGRDYLSTKLGKPVKETLRRTTKLSSPIYASAMGLLDLIIDMSQTQSTSSQGGIKQFFQDLWGN